MILDWKSLRADENAPLITPENVHEHTQAHAKFGVFELLVSFSQRLYKDGTRQYQAYVYIPGAESSQWITLVRVRGHLADAIEAAEYKLFKQHDGYRQYRLPVEAICVADEQTSKLLQKKTLCFECDSDTCAFNPEGVCMYPILYGKEPNISNFNGCSGWTAREDVKL